MFNVTIKFNVDEDFIKEEIFARRNKMRKEFFDELVKDGLIENLNEDQKGNVTFRVTFGGTPEFLSKLPKMIWHFRVIDKSSQIKLEAVPAV